MSVTQTTNLADQPASGIGSISYIPLGGNGFLAPKSVYLVSIGITGDATGGTSSIIVTQDPRWQHLVTEVQLRQIASTSRLYEMTVGKETSVAGVDATFRVQGTSRVGPAGNTTVDWNPAPLFDISRLTLSVENIDTVVTTMTALIYNFNIRADKQVPMNLLLQNVPRCSSVFDGILQ